MRRWITVVCCALLMGCASTPEVKLASANIGLSLSALHDAQREFRDRFLDELDETRRLIGRAIVAEAVTARVAALSEEETQGDLIEISGAIKAERDAFRRLVDELLTAEPGEDESDDDVLDRVLNQAPALRNAADQLEEIGDRAAAAELRARAEALESGAGAVAQSDDMLTLVGLARTKQDVRTGMADLEAYVQFLNLVHATVNEWIVTDVTVDGSDVAALIERATAETGGPAGSR